MRKRQKKQSFTTQAIRGIFALVFGLIKLALVACLWIALFPIMLLGALIVGMLQGFGETSRRRD